MSKRKSTTLLHMKSKKSELIEELNRGEFVIGEEVIETEQSIQVSGKKQGRNPPEEYRFKPGQSGNPSGRPKDLLRSIGMKIAQKKAVKILSKEELELVRNLDMNPNDITVIEAVMTLLATSTNKDKLELFMDRTFGKVPNININAEISTALVTRFRSKFTDAELQRIASGEEALEILLEKLPDVENVQVEDEVIEVEEDE